jgi:hypothetical protein
MSVIAVQLLDHRRPIGIGVGPHIVIASDPIPDDLR